MQTREVGGIPAHEIDMADITLAKDAADTLEKHYPGWAWHVHVSSEGGVVYLKSGIIAAALMRDYAWVYHLSDINWNYQVMAILIFMAGGEMLERAGMRRGPYKGEEIIHVEGVRENHQPIRGIVLALNEESIVL